MTQNTHPADDAFRLSSLRSDTEGESWQDRLTYVVEMMRDISTRTEPEEMVRAYSRRMARFRPGDALISVSRRNLDAPWYRMTRNSAWTEQINPWRNPEQLPLLRTGLLGELLYGDEARIIDELEPEPDDPAFEYLRNYRSLIAIPVYDDGVALNMTVFLAREPGAFDPEQLPERVWTTNLFGRATQNLVLKRDLDEAYRRLNRELRVIADLQRSLLPRTLPRIPRLDVAAHYQPSAHAGGDYYDVFELPEGKWGLLIADVCGHGAPAAVLMAVTHALAHTYVGEARPCAMLDDLNRRLHDGYTAEHGSFVTAFFGVFDPETLRLDYASAGHPQPRVKRCADGTLFTLDCARSVPLGIIPGHTYDMASVTLEPGDQIVLYTDGVTEAMNPAREMFETRRLDEALENCSLTAEGLIADVLRRLGAFAGGATAPDDQTMLVAKVS
ncbi:MAG: PP2C family protein-serine/threonine phosphatase [Phycisphaerales bacterium JB039]